MQNSATQSGNGSAPTNRSSMAFPMYESGRDGNANLSVRTAKPAKPSPAKVATGKKSGTKTRQKLMRQSSAPSWLPEILFVDSDKPEEESPSANSLAPAPLPKRDETSGQIKLKVERTSVMAPPWQGVKYAETLFANTGPSKSLAI